MKRLYWSFVALATFFGMIFFLNWTFQFCSDDCFYGSMCVDGVGRRLGTLGNALTMTLQDPHRPFVHFVVRAFTGCFDKWVFNVCNSLMMVLLVLLVNRLAFKSWKLNVHSVVLTIAMAFLVLCKGESYLWCAGSVNYLWVAVWTMGFCLIRERLESGVCAWWQVILFVLAAVICGGSNETFTPPMCMALFICSLLNIRQLSAQKVFVYAAYAVPAMMMVLYERSARIEGLRPEMTMQMVVMTVLKVAVTVKCVWVMLLVYLFSSANRGFFRRNVFELVLIGTSVAVVLVAGFHGERTLWCANLFAMVVVVREWRPRAWFSAVASLAVLGVFICLVPLGLRIRANFSSFIAQYLRAEDFVACHEYVACGYFKRYFHQVMYQWQKPSTHPFFLARYYGRPEPPVGLSKELYDGVYKTDSLCFSANQLKLKGGIKAYTTPSMNTIVIPLDQNRQLDPKTQRVEVFYEFPGGLFARIRRDLNQSERPVIGNAGHPVLLETTHGRYFLVVKEPLSDEYIQDVAFP